MFLTLYIISALICIWFFIYTDVADRSTWLATSIVGLLPLLNTTFVFVGVFDIITKKAKVKIRDMAIIRNYEVLTKNKLGDYNS